MQKMGSKNIYLKYALMLSVLLIALPMVLGAGDVVWVNPLTGGELAGSNFVFNLTNSTTTFNEMRNCTIYISSPSTATSRVILVTANTTVANFYVYNDTTTLEDSNDYTLVAQCTNSSNHQSNNASITVRVNNDVPDAPSITSHSNHQVISTAGTETFSFTVNDSETTLCTYSIARGGAVSGDDYTSGSGTYSGSTCSFTKAFSGSGSNGPWYVYATASDGSNTTSSTLTIVDVGIAPNSGGLPNVPGADEVNPEPTQSSSTAVWIIVGFLCFIILIIIIIYLASHKN